MIRRLTPRDLEAYRKLWLEGLRLFPDAFLLTESEARLVSDATLTRALAAGHHWGAEQDGTVVAIATLRRAGPHRLQHTADIGPFYVQPAAQGRGLGRQLLDAMLASAREEGLLQVELCVDAENKRAQQMYRNAGFEQFGRRPRSVMIDNTPRDDLLMLCKLDDATP
ncbi:N-acetyltransferase family protein [Primorskyibacter sp. S187A]|uniref:GNAT family N-acetyltransferase n=1 Tax=Primorskyibacter sp. S187A TaxID=3415130 RepID=UPI003C7E0E5A